MLTCTQAEEVETLILKMTIVKWQNVNDKMSNTKICQMIPTLNQLGIMTWKIIFGISKPLIKKKKILRGATFQVWYNKHYFAKVKL